MRTLVVEDEKHLNRMISEAILDEGYSVDSCFDGLEALELCECAQYDVIVLDIMMRLQNAGRVSHLARQRIRQGARSRVRRRLLHGKAL